MYKLFASLIGVIIAIMLGFNGVLSEQVGSLAPLPIIHIAGLLTVSIWLLFVKEKRTGDKVPLYLNMGGFFGVFLVLMNNRCFTTLGASMTLSLGIVGQMLGSIIADSTGFLGMKKYPFNPKKIIGLILLFCGVFIMTERWKGDFFNIFLALSAGLFVIMSMIFNSQLSLRIGTFHSVRRNYLVGLMCTVLVLIFVDFSPTETLLQMSEINPIYLIGGGFCGVLVVAGSNRVLPKIPIIYSTLLIFGGQALAGMIIDYFLSGEVSFRKILGTLVIISGLVVNMVLEKTAVKPVEIA